jgi:hypothetical protein
MLTHAILDGISGDEAGVERAFTEAKSSLPRCQASSRARRHCIEPPSRDLHLVEWEHREDHTEGSGVRAMAHREDLVRRFSCRFRPFRTTNH